MARGARRRIVEANVSTPQRSRTSTRRGSSPGRSGAANDSGHGSMFNESTSVLGTPSKRKQSGNILHSTPLKLINAAQAGSSGIKDTPDHLYGLDADTDTDTEGQNTTKRDVAVGHEPRTMKMIIMDGIKWSKDRVTHLLKSYWIPLLVVFLLVFAVCIGVLLYNRPEEETCSADPKGQAPFQPEILNELKEQMKELTSLVNGMSAGIASSTAGHRDALSKQELAQKLDEYMEAYSADKVGMPDYALEASGGRIHKPHVSPTNTNGAAKVHMFGVPVFIDAKDPSVILQPDNTPGNCWPMRGQRGYVVIQLAQSVIPLSFTMEHIPKTLSLTGDDTIPSAPKDFSVFGWHDPEGENKTLLGRYTYDNMKKPLQTFPVDLPSENNLEPFLYVELNIHNNYGEPHYTCIYRFRVHGQPRQVLKAPVSDDSEVDVKVVEEKQ